MANTRPNPFSVVTPMGEGLSNVFQAFMSAPSQEERAADALKIHGLQAGAKRDLAAAGYDTSRTAGQDISNTALRSLPTLNFDAPSAQGTVMQTMGGNYASLADPFLVHMANRPGATPQSLDALAYAKTGNAPNTFAGQAVTDTTNRRGQDLTSSAARYGHDRSYAASTQNNVRDNQRARDLFNVETSPGAITTLAPGNPLGVTTIAGNPTDATQKGEIIQTQRGQPGFDPMAPVDAQSSFGSALGTPNEASGGMTLTVGEDGTVQMTQGGGLPISPSAVKENLDAQTSIESYARTSKTVRDIAMTNPTLFGTPGNVRRTAQAVMQQGRAVMDMMTASDPSLGATTDEAFATVQQDLAQLGVADPMVYDPNLTDIDKMAILLAYKAASAVADQSGRGLSDQDFAKFRTVVGDPTSWLSTQQSFVAGLNRLDMVALGELNAQRKRLGQPLLTRDQFQAMGVAPEAQPTQQPQGAIPPPPPGFQVIQ
jgi:hypothetical protein